MEIIKISDMYLAAAILSYGATLVEIDRTDAKRLKFCFQDDIKNVYSLAKYGTPQTISEPSIQDVEAMFISKTLMFPPQYPESVRSIKAAIYSHD